MKKIYFLLIISMVGIRFSYAQDTTSLAGKMQFIFAQLNRSAISTGFLEERAFPLVSLTPFNGILTDSNKVMLNTLRATYFTHYTACMLNANPMLPIDSINARINQYLPFENTIPIAIHLGELNSFKNYAVANNLISIGSDDVLRDVPGRPENPYLLKYLFAASPLKSDFATGNFALVFRPNLFFTNSSLTVSALYIDFDDGIGYQSAAWNTALYPNYSTAGTKNIKLKIVMSNNSQYECYTPVTVANILAVERYAAAPPIPVPFYATSNHSGGRIFVHLSSSNNTGHLKKPLIVVEGYDAAQIAPDLSGRNYSFSDFIEAVNKVSELGYDFNYQLDDIGGYDLVFMDYNYGTDYIERNANLFKAVINWVNADKALSGSTQKNVVLGISMGGLVARYGLAQMTKNNETTDTRLLITHDSPHQGANVPVGLQKVVQALGRVTMYGFSISRIMPQYSEAIALLNEPASQQMLTYKSVSHDGPIQNNIWLNNTYRPMVTFASTGPQPSYRFIATSQGSECGTQLFAPATQLLSAQASAKASVFLGFFGGKFSADIQARALPALGGSIQLAKVKMESKIRFLFIRVEKKVFDFTYNISSSTLLPIDGASGGMSPVGATTLNGSSAGGAVLGLLYSFRISGLATLSNFTFVPTPSALDVQTYDMASLSSSYTGGWSPRNPSRAATFIAQEAHSGSFNESHASFTARNAEWLFKEMEGVSNTLNCSANCSANLAGAISGPYEICGSATYTIPNLPAGSVVNWSVAPAGVLSYTASGNTATFTKVGYAETAVITATITTPCGNVTTSKYVKPGNYLVIYDRGPICPNTGGNIFSSNQTLTANYLWKLRRTDGSTPRYMMLGERSPRIDLFVYETGTFILSFSLTNSCGVSQTQIPITVVDYGCIGGYPYMVYPNPSSSELKISQKLVEDVGSAKKMGSNIFSVKLLNEKGKILKAGKVNANSREIVLQVADIPNGIYYLHIYEGKNVKKQQVVISH